MRAELIGHFKACMTDIYIHIDARMADYIRTHMYSTRLASGVDIAMIAAPAWTTEGAPSPAAMYVIGTEPAERLMFRLRTRWDKAMVTPRAVNLTASSVLSSASPCVYN